MKITHDQFFNNSDRYLDGIGNTRVTSASDLGWPAGYWPNQLEPEASIGNGQPFHPVFKGEDVVTYEQDFGTLRLRVYND